jgi:aryl-alcohol dehydrogenase-like predicted oxidoreductase
MRQRQLGRDGPLVGEIGLSCMGMSEDSAREVGATPAQVALAWVLAQGEDIIAIPGAKRVKDLEKTVRAADLRLTPLQLTILAPLAPPGVVGSS